MKEFIFWMLIRLGDVLSTVFALPLLQSGLIMEIGPGSLLLMHKFGFWSAMVINLILSVGAFFILKRFVRPKLRSFVYIVFILIIISNLTQSGLLYYYGA